MPDREQRLRWPLPAGAAMLAGLCAAAVVADPYLSTLVPRSVWDRLFLGDSAVRLTPILVAAVLAGLFLLRLVRRAGDYKRLFVFTILISAQANGLRVGFLDVVDLFTLVFFLVWLADQLIAGDEDVALPGAMFFALALLALDLPNLVHQQPVKFVIGWLGLAKVVLLAFVIINVINTEARMRLAVRVFAAVAIASAVVTVAQFALWYVTGIRITLIDDPEAAFKPTPIGLVMRASGLCVTAQHVSGFLVLALPFIMYELTSPDCRHRRLLALGLGVQLLGILLTWNFGALIIGAAVVGLFPFVRWPQASLQLCLGYLSGALAAYYSGLLHLFYNLTFGDSGVAKGVSQRHDLMAFAFEKLHRDPWLGTGLRGMAEFSGNYWHRPPHNAYLQAATEIGLAGGLVLLGMMLTLVTQLAVVSVRAAPRFEWMSRAMLLSLLGLMGLMTSEPMLDHSNTWLIVGLAQSLLLIVVAAERARPFRSPAGGA